MVVVSSDVVPYSRFHVTVVKSTLPSPISPVCGLCSVSVGKLYMLICHEILKLLPISEL